MNRNGTPSKIAKRCVNDPLTYQPDIYSEYTDYTPAYHELIISPEKLRDLQEALTDIQFTLEYEPLLYAIRNGIYCDLSHLTVELNNYEKGFADKNVVVRRITEYVMSNTPEQKAKRLTSHLYGTKRARCYRTLLRALSVLK